LENSKLINLLRTFSRVELRELHDFVRSPFFNKKKQVTELYNYLKKIAPHFPPAKIEREHVYKKIYGNEKYNDTLLNHVMSDLFQLVEQYIGWAKYQKEKVLVNTHILDEYVERDLEKHYQYLYRKTAQLVEEETLRNTDFYYQNFLLANLAEKHFDKKKLRKFDNHLQIVADNFDVYYLAKKLKHSCEMLDRQRVVAADYEMKFVEEVSDFLKKNNYDNIPPIAIYRRILITLKDDQADEQYQELKILIERHINHFPKFEMKQIYLAILNFCIRKIRNGNRIYADEALELYLKGIENRVLFEGEHLSPWTYKNVVVLGIGLKKYEWTEKFIYNYNNKLPAHFREDALHYNLADLYYRNKVYDKAIEHLRNVEFTDVYYSLDTRLMLAKIYYETNETEALLSLISSFRIFIKRNKLIAQNVKESYTNFLKIIHLLVKKEGKESIEKIKETIEKTQLLMDKRWLKEQLK